MTFAADINEEDAWMRGIDLDDVRESYDPGYVDSDWDIDMSDNDNAWAQGLDAWENSAREPAEKLPKRASLERQSRRARAADRTCAHCLKLDTAKNVSEPLAWSDDYVHKFCAAELDFLLSNVRWSDMQMVGGD